jgi:hypothetical protein
MAPSAAASTAGADVTTALLAGVFDALFAHRRSLILIVHRRSHVDRVR